ncbi:nuclease-related domain-containing protein [Bacillus sp. Marseille-P3661]|uniref:nuclease-related domain-containing protein n=1 Tax=Bacillus sp. Marseille-P3661 TaxID=1936234 RepID=UPI000C82F520|nr:nuclease-related domain-containing protein [Bacillus sp. Marseille-P3661]
MLYKSRSQSAELLILRSLNARMSLSDKDQQHYQNLKKGYEGEVIFDSFTEKLACDCYILNDLLFKFNGTQFQIDSLIITSDTIYCFEVKNYEGDYFYESERFYTKTRSEISSPLTQLSRSESMLRQLLQNLGNQLPIQAFVVFINPEFTLYQTPLNKPMIFRSQVNRYMKNLSTIPFKLDKKHKILADKLLVNHIKDSPILSLPSYDYEQLQKGIPCISCGSLSITVSRTKCVCEECGHEETVTNAVLRCVEEFQRLFPSQKITTNTIFDWCGVVKSKERIRMILKKYYKIIGVHQWAFYE